MFKTTPEVGGMGHSIKRKEDLRFVQGKGNYVDDVHLPDMVYGHLVRSPYAHARLKSINTDKAKQLPGVLAVITGEDLAKANLAWMPTLFFDKQMVLATGKVLFQSQEVAFVIAEDRYTAADAAELVEVEYEELPVLVDPHKATDPSSPILREDREEKSNHIFHWEVGDRQATDKVIQNAAVTAKVHAFFQRCHPAPLETCGCVADFNSATGRLTVYLTSQAPHAHRQRHRRARVLRRRFHQPARARHRRARNQVLEERQVRADSGFRANPWSRYPHLGCHLAGVPEGVAGREDQMTESPGPMANRRSEQNS